MKNNITTLIYSIPTTLFMLGILLLFLNSKNLLLAILYLELLILSCFTNFLILTKLIPNTNNYVYSFLLLSIAAAETGIGLSLMLLIVTHSKGTNWVHRLAVSNNAPTLRR